MRKSILKEETQQNKATDCGSVMQSDVKKKSIDFVVIKEKNLYTL